jgi:signal transduction histidine kinase
MDLRNNTFDNQQRLEALFSYQVLDTDEENDFNEIVDLASRICNMPISLVSLVDDRRQWFKARHGFTTKQTPVEIAFCKHAIEHDSVFVVEDATLDRRFKDNPLVTSNPDIRFYAGAPLQTPEGFNLGTLCVLDVKPNALSFDQLEALKILGKQVIKQFELRKAMYALNKKNEKILAQHDDFVKLLTFKDRIFSVISHDLRGPIANVEQVLGLFDSVGLDPTDFNEFVPVLKNQVKQTSAILNNLLTWANPYQEGQLPDKKSIHIESLVHEVLQTLNVDIAKKELEVKVLIDENVGEQFLDESSLIIVVRNLVKNSIKFCNKHDTITIGCSLNKKQLDFFVKDTGVGFDAGVAQKLFNELEHITTYGTANEKGTGLGLLICKNLVEQNGGAIWAEGEPNQGATFYFTITV